MKKIAVSGGMDPLHIGHVRMFQEARKLGDYLIVILNNDNFLKRKKGFAFMPQEERKELIELYNFVDEVYIHNPTNPEDMTVCEALEKLVPHTFANGGDRYSHNTPEDILCKKLGITTEYNVGGEKIQSSSDMVKQAQSSTK